MCLQGTSRRYSTQVSCVFAHSSRPGLGVNQPHCLKFFLAAIWRDIPIEDLNRLVAKWTDQPPCGAHLVGASTYGVHMVRG
jgi:hypothetical protein